VERTLLSASKTISQLRLSYQEPGPPKKACHPDRSRCFAKRRICEVEGPALKNKACHPDSRRDLQLTRPVIPTGGWPKLLTFLFQLRTRWVPHPCVLCKGGIAMLPIQPK